MCNCGNHLCFITIQATTASGSFNLPENNRIRNGVVRSIQLRRLGSLTGKSSTGATLAPDTVIATAHLRLLNENGTEIMILPLQTLQRDYNSPEPLRVRYENIDPQSSVITLDTGASGYAATQVIEMTFEMECDNCGVSR